MAAKKILYVDYYSFLGGGQTNLLSVFSSLDRRRYQPLLALPHEGPFAGQARALKVPVFILPMGKARWRRPWEAWPAMRRIQSLITREKVSLVHANCYPANKLAAVAARFAGVPCIWHKQIAVTQKPGSTTGRLWRLFSRLNPRILAVSRQVVEGLAALGIEPGKIRLLYNNADVKALSRHAALAPAQRKKWGIPAAAPLVGTAGMRRYHKGFDVFLKACASVAEARPGVHFVLVGDGAHAEEGHEKLLAGLAADPRLKGRLHLVPAQNPLAPWLKAMDVFVSSSRWEGSPLVVLEAMALGRPVVATRAAAGELLADGKQGSLVEAEDAASLSRAILRLVSQPALAARLGKAARARILKEFDLPIYADKLMSIYDEVLR